MLNINRVQKPWFDGGNRGDYHMSLETALARGNNNLDLVRIFAALMVIFGHSFALSFNQEYTEPFNYLFPFTYSGSIAVKVFFFISGVLVTNSLISSGNIAKFSVARFFRIYPAFAFTIVVSSLLIGPIAYQGELSQYFSSSGFKDYITHSLHFDTQYFIEGVFVGNKDNGSINGSLWTIALEISAYFVVLSAYIFTGFKNKAISSAICMFVIIMPLTSIEGFNFIIERNSEAFLLPSIFALGSLYAINKDKIIVDWKIPLAFFILYKTSYSPYLSQFTFYAGLCTSILYFSTFKTIRNIKIRHDISYGIYLWGFPIQQLLNYFYHMDTVTLIFSSAFLSIIAGYVSYLLIERPSMNIGKKVSSFL